MGTPWHGPRSRQSTIACGGPCTEADESVTVALRPPLTSEVAKLKEQLKLQSNASSLVSKPEQWPSSTMSDDAFRLHLARARATCDMARCWNM